MSHAQEDTIELEVEVLEAVAPSPTSYPYPSLSRTGRKQNLTFRTLVLENDWARAVFIPDLGGRLISFYDRSAGTERIPQCLEFVNGGPRGVSALGGVQLTILGERLNSLGPVSSVLTEQGHIRMFELCAGTGLSWQTWLGLDPDEAAIHLRVVVQNRTLDAVPYNSGLSVPKGIHVQADPGTLAASQSQWSRFSTPGELGPRCTDTWLAKIVAGEHSEPEVNQAPFVWTSPLRQIYEQGVSKMRRRERADEELNTAMADPVCRPAAWLAKGYQHLAGSDFPNAMGCFESASFYDGEETLTWVMKAITHRLAGRNTEEEENDDLLNAHYISPLEPALRAESFLASNQASREPSAIVTPMADDPEAMIDFAATLLEAGLDSELFRWVDECLRHRDIPSLRYLLAYAYLRTKTMAFEAASQVGQAAKTPINPPYPWRPIERLALEELASRFPNDERIARLLEIDWGNLGTKRQAAPTQQ